MALIDSLASPKHMAVFSLKNSGFWTPAYPALMPRLKTTTRPASHTWSTGMPEIGVPCSMAAGLTVSLAPMTRTTSVFLKSSLISSISRTMSYGTCASASSTFMWPGRRPATGWMPKRTSTSWSCSLRTSSATGACACETAMP